MTLYLRGELAKEAQINIETLRFYEKNGLIPLPQRSAGGYRLYPEETLLRIDFIRNAKSCGFTLHEIKKALVKSADSSIGISDFVEVIERKMASVDLEIARCKETRSKLEALKSGLVAHNRHPGVQETLDILNMKD
ncbi:MerR family transcriptional regulator [Paenibacillus tritici]|uniref:MerR family transcriptional regulator n=2 Tax=Paenibacillus tritici TaxID=1873425 RepID=A0ABX2DHS0_9BACL|nr:MerR family transcriptional regulator [Paenibacillus tritici]NQX44158.1 MerR family transcriptional regulator [Paenibacillus tritici]